MTDLKQNNDIVYKKGIWKSFAMMIFLFAFITSTFLIGLVSWLNDSTWNEILSEIIFQSKLAFIVSFILIFYAINSNTFYKSHIIVFYLFLLWRRKVYYSEIIFAEFIRANKGPDAIKFYKKKRKKVSMETSSDYIKIFKLLNSNNIPLVITESNNNSRLKKEIKIAEVLQYQWFVKRLAVSF